MASKTARSTKSERAVFDRTPPQNIEAERSVLGAMLLNPDAVGVGVEILKDRGEDMFYHEPHQHIYDAVVQLFAANQPVDAITLLNQLSLNGKLEASGGATYLAELTRAVPTSANIEVYARIVLEAAMRRNVIATATRLVSEAYAGETPAQDMLDRAESEIFRMAESQQFSPVSSAADLAPEALHRIEQQIKTDSKITGVPSGFAKLDELLAGFKPADMVVLAARPSVGKTAFSLNIAAHAAVVARKSVLIFSLEMSKESLMQRLLCIEGRVDGSRLRTGFLAKAEFPKLQRAADTLSQAPIYIDDTPGISVLEMRSKARRQAAKHSLDMIIIDYLQLMNGDKRAESRQVQIAEISRSVKALARELRIPVIALSQLSREAEKDESGMPKLSHLRESGAIEQDADVVLMLARKPRTEAENDNIINVNLAKHRNGPTGFFELLFEKQMQKFRDLAGDGYVPAPPPEVSYTVAHNIEDTYDEDDVPF
jgi:replicative DNA helicase